MSTLRAEVADRTDMTEEELAALEQRWEVAAARRARSCAGGHAT